MDESTYEKFEEGVMVNFPGQKRPIRARRLDRPSDEIMKHTVPDGFHPFRLVINLRMVDAEMPDQEVSTFEPAIEIRVFINKADFAKAADAGGLPCLGFWDGEKWIRFPFEKPKFHTEADPSKVPGVWGVLTISSWVDPPIAVGT